MLSQYQIEQQKRDVEDSTRALKGHIKACADACRGNLRYASVWHNTLCELKKELAKYNMRTGEWKD